MRYLFFCLFPLLLTAACSDDDQLSPVNQLPPATQTGENIVACLIDGEPWVNDPNRTGEVNISASYYWLNNSITIHGYDRLDDYNTYIGLRIPIDTSISPHLDSNSIIFQYREPINQVIEYKLEARSGFINIAHLDETARVLSGEFSGLLINAIRNDTLKITDGRFDVPYY